MPIDPNRPDQVYEPHEKHFQVADNISDLLNNTVRNFLDRVQDHYENIRGAKYTLSDAVADVLYGRDLGL